MRIYFADFTDVFNEKPSWIEDVYSRAIVSIARAWDCSTADLCIVKAEMVAPKTVIWQTYSDTHSLGPTKVFEVFSDLIGYINGLGRM